MGELRIVHAGAMIDASWGAIRIGDCEMNDQQAIQYPAQRCHGHVQVTADWPPFLEHGAAF
jgi:hypothetical protein